MCDSSEQVPVRIGCLQCFIPYILFTKSFNFSFPTVQIVSLGEISMLTAETFDPDHADLCCGWSATDLPPLMDRSESVGVGGVPGASGDARLSHLNEMPDMDTPSRSEN